MQALFGPVRKNNNFWPVPVCFFQVVQGPGVVEGVEVSVLYWCLHLQGVKESNTFSLVCFEVG